MQGYLFLTFRLTMRITEFTSMEILDALLNSSNVLRVGKHLLSLTNSKNIYVESHTRGKPISSKPRKK